MYPPKKISDHCKVHPVRFAHVHLFYLFVHIQQTGLFTSNIIHTYELVYDCVYVSTIFNKFYRNPWAMRVFAPEPG